MLPGRAVLLPEPDGRWPLALPVPPGMPWMTEGVRLLREGVGVFDEDRALMLRIAVALDRISPVDVAWCGLFVWHCLKKAYPRTRTPWLPMRARPWLGYGRPVAPQVGALAVFWLYGRRSPFGHSGFIWAEDREAFHVLGGNQRDNIRIQRVGRNRLLGTRWPGEAWPPPGLVRQAAPTHAAPPEWGADEPPLARGRGGG